MIKYKSQDNLFETRDIKHELGGKGKFKNSKVKVLYLSTFVIAAIRN